MKTLSSTAPSFSIKTLYNFSTNASGMNKPMFDPTTITTTTVTGGVMNFFKPMRSEIN